MKLKEKTSRQNRITEDKEAAELYRTLANSSPVGVYIVQDGKFQFVNPQFQKYTGYSEAELIGKESLGLVHPDDRERVRESAIAMLKGTRLDPYELRYIVKNGETFWATETVTSIRYKGKRATLGNFMDITQQKQVEETLRLSREKLRRMFEAVTDGILVIDLNGVITEVNQRAVEMHGYKSKGELFGKSAFRLVAPHDHERILAHIRKAIKEGKAEGAECTLLKANGDQFPAELNTSILSDSSGQPVAHITTVRDITERKRMEKELQQAKEQFQLLVEESPLGVAMITKDGRYQYVNPKFTKMFGYTLEDIPTRQEWFIKAYPDPEYRKQVISAWDSDTKILESGEVSQRIFNVTCKDGSKKVILFRPVALVTGDRLMIYEDITEQKRLEEQLKQQMEELQLAYQKLKELDQLKDNFLSTVSHELRTPLTSIKSFSEILLSYDEDKETQREFLNIINEESDRLTRLINDFLDLAKIEAGRMRWEDAPQSLPEIIQTALNATQALALKTGLRIETELEPALPTVCCDKDRLVQVMTNLLSNAIKFTPEGGTIKIKAKRLETTKPDDTPDMVIVSVADSGIGIDPKEHKSIFEKFKQGGNTLSGKPKGTGLGLPICKEIIEHYGGRIWVESAVGKGSTFFFTLPITPQAQTKVTEDKTQEVSAAPRGDKKILVVDDEANIRRFLKHELTVRGYHVLEATGGKEAIDLARSYHPDLIILDILMPDISGHDVTAVLKSDPETKDIPILVLSILEEKEKAYQLGANDFLTKPFTIKLLLDRINRLLKDTQKTILVVDDDKSLVRSLKYRLEKRGYLVQTAYSGKEALKTAQSHLPNLILLDIVMPEMDGYEVMKALRQNPNTAKIPIVVMTGFENVGGKVQALSAGATEYHQKSSGFDQLLRTIETILNGKSAG